MHAIMRVDTGEFVSGYDENGEPYWSDKKEDAKTFLNWSAASMESNRLNDNFYFVSMPVNLENKQL